MSSLWTKVGFYKYTRPGKGQYIEAFFTSIASMLNKCKDVSVLINEETQIYN